MAVVAFRNNDTHGYDKKVTYSFDIFDTCLVRKCGEPNMVFDLMSERAFTKQVPSEEKRAFVVARLEAASKSWSDKQTLLNIYDAFQFGHPDILPKNKLMELELTVEREMLSPVKDMVNYIASLREAGSHIIFISDMYLGEE